METAVTRQSKQSMQSIQNREYVRRLLRQKQPGASAALELAVVLVERELRSAQQARHVDAAAGHYPQGGFTRDFATADGETVMVAALTRQQFADLARAARLARIFAFLERVLHADFSAADDLYTYQGTIAALLIPWFARQTVADLAAAFAGTAVPWARRTT
jgi:2-methylfumaryl-CoA isomerase